MAIHLFSRSLVSALALATAVALLAPVHAQSYGTQGQQQSATRDFRDEKLQSYAAAVTEVRALRSEYQPQIQSAGTVEERQQLQRRATDEMVQAVEDKGISVA